MDFKHRYRRWYYFTSLFLGLSGVGAFYALRYHGRAMDDSAIYAAYFNTLLGFFGCPILLILGLCRTRPVVRLLGDTIELDLSVWRRRRTIPLAAVQRVEIFDSTGQISLITDQGSVHIPRKIFSPLDEKVLIAELRN